MPVTGNEILSEQVRPALCCHRFALLAELGSATLHGPAVDQILAQENLAEGLTDDDRVHWLLGDHQQTTRDVVDHAGALVSGGHLVYDSFGNVQSGDKTLTRYLYTAQEYDAHTGAYLYNLRWYDPATGSWHSEDFIWDGTNKYAYVGNSAINYVDPDGLDRESEAELEARLPALMDGPIGPPGVAIEWTEEMRLRWITKNASSYEIFRGEIPTPPWESNCPKPEPKYLTGYPGSGLPWWAQAIGPGPKVGRIPGSKPTPKPAAGTVGIRSNPSSKPVHIDIGGEGRYPHAVNVNKNSITSTTPPRPIPNLVKGAGERLPFADRCAAGISVESAPITKEMAAEIARVIQPGGSIRLVSPTDYANIAHPRVISQVGGSYYQTTSGGITTTVITAPATPR